MAKKTEKLSRIHWLILRSDSLVQDSELYNNEYVPGHPYEPFKWTDGHIAACSSMASAIVLFLLNNPDKEKEILGETYQGYLDL